MIYSTLIQIKHVHRSISFLYRLGRRRSKTQECSSADSRNSAADSDSGLGRPRGATTAASSGSGVGSDVLPRGRSATALSLNEDESGEVDSVCTTV